MKIKEMNITCPGAPIVWEGRNEDGREFYIRYRHGHLSAHYEDALSRRWPGIPDPFFAIDYGDDLDGWMKTKTMLELTGFEYDGDPAAVDDDKTGWIDK